MTKPIVPTKLTPLAVRRRLELLAPELAEGLAEIGAGLLKRWRLSEADDAYPEARLKVEEVCAISREYRSIAKEGLDRGGAPSLKQVQMEQHVTRYEKLSEREMLTAVQERLAKLGEGDRALLAQLAPGLESLVAGPEGEQ